MGPSDHACLAYEDGEERVRAAVAHLAEGRDLGNRLIYAADASLDELLRELEPLGDVRGMIDGGALSVVTSEDMYLGDGPLDPQVQLETYSSATDAALSDGYTGLRVAADMGGLALDPDGWSALLRWEHLADVYMSQQPMSAMCSYNRHRVPEPVVRDIARVHPLGVGEHRPAGFHLFARDGVLALAGDVDLFGAGDLERLLDMAAEMRDELVIDLADLGFLDHHGFEALATRDDVELRNPPLGVRRLAALMGEAS